MLTLIRWWGWCLPDSALQSCFFPLPYSIFGSKSLCPIYTQRREWRTKLHINYLKFFCREICLFSPLSIIYLLIYLYKHRLMYIYVILCVIIHYYIFYLFCCSIVLPLAIGSFFRSELVSLDNPLTFWFLSTSLLLEITRCSRLILYFSWPALTISHFFKELCFLLLNSNIRNQNLGTYYNCLM